jgi:dTDP-4-dehydrorhamnose reductase
VVNDGRVLITGADGQLGSDLGVLLTETSGVWCAGKTELDITHDAAVTTAMADFAPSLVLNCAAFHNVDQCERDDGESFEINVRAVRRLAEACAAASAKLVHFSTNYVFDGLRPEPYAEHDPPAPRSVYAISKLAGEHVALAYSPHALVVRTSGLYGLHGSASKGGNFVTRMVARAREQGKLRMVADQKLTPTFTADLAQAVVAAVDANAEGVLHLTNTGECSWYEFTSAIMKSAGIEISIERVETSTRPGEPQRPRNGVLRSTRLEALGLSPLRPWRDALTDYMRRADLIATTN